MVALVCVACVVGWCVWMQFGTAEIESRTRMVLASRRKPWSKRRRGPKPKQSGPKVSSESAESAPAQAQLALFEEAKI